VCCADGFSSASLSVRMQKKIAGKLSSRTLARHLINEPTARILDHVYILLKMYYDKQTAEKVVVPVPSILYFYLFRKGCEAHDEIIDQNHHTHAQSSVEHVRNALSHNVHTQIPTTARHHHQLPPSSCHIYSFVNKRCIQKCV
jgi:hypothetical protein